MDLDNFWMPLVTIGSHCIPTNGTVLLDFITTNNVTCSLIENKLYTKVVHFAIVCKNAITLMHCMLLDGQSESVCKFACQCKEDFPCQLWIQTGSEDFYICEILVLSANKF